MTQGKKLMR